jgi:F-type H+-transporting ATPase subunit beta
MERALRVRNFLTQPMFVAAPFTGRPGRFVARADTVRGCAALLAGAGDRLPPEAFLNRGTLDEALSME